MGPWDILLTRFHCIFYNNTRIDRAVYLVISVVLPNAAASVGVFSAYLSRTKDFIQRRTRSLLTCLRYGIPFIGLMLLMCLGVLVVRIEHVLSRVKAMCIVIFEPLLRCGSTVLGRLRALLL